MMYSDHLKRHRKSGPEQIKVFHPKFTEVKQTFNIVGSWDKTNFNKFERHFIGWS